MAKVEPNKAGPVKKPVAEWRGPVIAAAVIMIAFGIMGYYLPPLMLALGERSQPVAAIFAIVFVVAFFAVFWLRARQQRRNASKTERGNQ